LTPKLVDALDVAKLSSNQAAKVIAATAHSLGVDISDKNINSTSIRCRREALRGESASAVKSSFNPDPILMIHFDKKTVESLSEAQSSKERLAIVATGVTTDLMIAAPELPNKRGEPIAKSVCDALEEWNITQNAKALNFDSTAANTGTGTSTNDGNF